MEQQGIVSTLEFKKDGSLGMDVNGATSQMSWNLDDDSSLILSTGVGTKFESGFTIADGKLFLTVDDSTAVYTKG